MAPESFLNLDPFHYLGRFNGGSHTVMHFWNVICQKEICMFWARTKLRIVVVLLPLTFCLFCVASADSANSKLCLLQIATSPAVDTNNFSKQAPNRWKSIFPSSFTASFLRWLNHIFHITRDINEPSNNIKLIIILSVLTSIKSTITSYFI